MTLGGNDILRKLPVRRSLESLREIFERLHVIGVMIVYVSLRPPLFGSELSLKIEELCEELGVFYVPNVMGEVWGNPALMSDQIHPNSEGLRRDRFESRSGASAVGTTVERPLNVKI